MAVYLGTTLTLWIADQQQNDQLQLHLWHGTQGLTLELRERPIVQWTAFATTKHPTEPRPATFAYGRERQRSGPTDQQSFSTSAYADGRVYVSRGDILLLTAPLAGPPDGVYFEGSAVLKGIGLAHVEGMPSRWTGEDLEQPNYFDYPQPVTWPASQAAEHMNELPPHAAVVPAGDEGLASPRSTRLSRHGRRSRYRADGFYDLVCEVERGDVGTGIYLGDETGRPRYPVGFHEYHAGEPLHLATGARRKQNLATAMNRSKVRCRRSCSPCVCGCFAGAGNIKVFVSTDGRSWGRIMDPIRGTDGRPATLGVFVASGQRKAFDPRNARPVRGAIHRRRAAARLDAATAGKRRLRAMARRRDSPRRSECERRTGARRRRRVASVTGASRGPVHAQIRHETARSLVDGLTIVPYPLGVVGREGRLYDFSTLCLIASAFDGGAASRLVQPLLAVPGHRSRGNSHPSHSRKTPKRPNCGG